MIHDPLKGKNKVLKKTLTPVRFKKLKEENCPVLRYKIHQKKVVEDDDSADTHSDEGEDISNLTLDQITQIKNTFGAFNKKTKSNPTNKVWQSTRN